MRNHTAILIVALFVVVCCCGSKGKSPRTTPKPKGPLENILVILDPGHGGMDEGSSTREINNMLVVEDEHCYDVALRLRGALVAQGATVVITVVDPLQDKPTDNKAGEFIKPDQNERLNGGNVRRCKHLKAGTRCLLRRIEIARGAITAHPKMRPVWISVHFDLVPDPLVEGVRIITSPDQITPGAQAIVDAFAEQPDRGRQRNEESWGPVVRSGDPAYGLHHMFVLGRANPIRERMLVELGNFLNPADRWRIRDPKIRQDYAERMARGVNAWNRQTPPASPDAGTKQK